MLIMGDAMSRKSKTSSFTSRKKTFGNYWLAHSNKTGLILHLASDRELAHWLLNLEFNPLVQSFQFDDFVSRDLIELGLPEVRYRVLARYVDGIEYHHISSSKSDDTKRQEQLIDAQLWQSRHIKYRHFSDEDFNCRKHQVFPLLRLSTFLTSCRDQYISPAIDSAVANYMNKVRRGFIQKYLADMPDFNTQVLMLKLYRLYSAGVVSLHYESTPFMLDTRWELMYGEFH